MSVWVVRGGVNGEREKDALDAGVVTIGYEGVRDLSQKHTELEVKTTVRDDSAEHWARATNWQKSLWTGNVWKFKGLINTGDLVVMPLKGRKAISLGEITGEYEYRSGVSPNLVHSRSVGWLHKEVLVNELDQDLQKSLSSQQTVYQPQSPNAEQRLRKLAGQECGIVDCNGEHTDYPWPPPNIAILAANLLWEPRYLQEIISDLQEKRQVIFYGPPGTGKTYVAREIAKQCRLNGGDFEIVQFHPSYSYEDFVEGFRPKLIGTQAGFELVHGPLRRIADKARSNRDATYILVIDELNRGNVAKVFGELYFLLEYRDEEVRLQYGGDGQGFSLPKNLWFICTMNTADRSIALMDAALRRRFYFAPFFPNEPPIKGLLGRWLEREGRDTLAAALIDEANKNLDRHAGIGPSYFMRPGQDLDEPTVRRIWDRAVIPYIEEQCFGDEEKLARFGFDRLKGQVSSGGSPNDAQLDGTDQSEGGDADPNAG